MAGYVESQTFSLNGRPRQRHPRFPLEVRVVRYDGGTDEWRSVNISESGLFVRGVPVLPAGTELEVGLWLPAEDDSVEVVSRARVIWHNDPNEPKSRPELPPGMGLELLGLGEDDRRVLQQQLYSQDESSAIPAAANEDDQLPAGCIIGSYRIIDLLGSGGMGHVYLAEHVQLGRRVALKRLHDRLSSQPGTVRRFFEEGKVVNRVHHQNILEITDFVADGADKCYVMELLDGESVASLVKRSAELSVERVLGICVQVCDALQAVHEAGIIHRDLKPGNIMLVTRDGVEDHVKLVDFGISKLSNPSDALSAERTAPGVLLGSPGYMAPEQAIGDEVDHRCDIYAFGVLLYQMLTRQLVFTANTWTEVLIKHVSERPIAPRNLRGDIPPDIEAVIMECLAKRRDERPSSARLLGERLRRMLTPGAGGPRPRPPPLPLEVSAELYVTGESPVWAALTYLGQRATETLRDARHTAIIATALFASVLVAVCGLRSREPAPAAIPPARIISNALPADDTGAGGSPLSADPSRAPSTSPAPSPSPTTAAATPPVPTAETSPEQPPKKKLRRRRGRKDPEASVQPVATLEQAAELIKAGYVKKGIRVTKEVIRADPRNGRAFRTLGIAYAIDGDRRMACESYRRYLIYTPKAADRDKVKQILRGCR